MTALPNAIVVNFPHGNMISFLRLNEMMKHLIKSIFIISHLALTLVNCQEGNISNPMFITVFYLFRSRESEGAS